jgi:hypothetical protein
MKAIFRAEYTLDQAPLRHLTFWSFPALSTGQ